jgi:hypothetical protein
MKKQSIKTFIIPLTHSLETEKSLEHPQIEESVNRQHKVD